MSTFFERIVNDISFFTEEAYIAINDAIYYDGVMKALLAFPVLGRQGFFVFNNYMPVVGKHFYFDGEGGYSI